MKIRTLDEITPVLRSYVRTVPMQKNYNLKRIVNLMDRIGNPQNRLQVVHIAGTSGKTSTAYFVRALLEQAGKRTGLTISPYLVKVTERVQIDGQPLPDDIFLTYLNEFIELVNKTGGKGSYFELMIAFAFWVFAKVGVDYAVVETGLGGLLDGTNVVDREDKICVLSDIGLDHTEILGDTIKQIAAQKAGIIRPRNHVIAQNQSSEVMRIFKQAAQKQQAGIEVVSQDVYSIDWLPTFQKRNWRLACATYNYIAKRDGLVRLSDNNYQVAAQQAPPGRMETFKVAGKTIILDGAHNPQKIQALVEALAAGGVNNIPVIANFMQAPAAKIKACLEELKPLTSKLLIPDFKMSQDMDRVSVPAQQLADYARPLGFRTEVFKDINSALSSLIKANQNTAVITGSLYLAHFARELLVELA